MKLSEKLERYRAASKLDKQCLWICADDGEWWLTGCDNSFAFIDGGPLENEMKYCSYCGGKLRVAPADQENETGK